MKILYFTDLHGDQNKYDKVKQLVEKHDIKIIINGGDMLPKDNNLFRDQKNFITEYLGPHFSLFSDKGIYYLNCLGNDDLRIHDELFEETCSKHPFITNIAQKKIIINGFTFIGMNWVDDYPFRLKDRCRVDGPSYIFQHQFGTGLLSTPNGYKEVKDWYGLALSLPSIKAELKKLPAGEDPKKTIYIIHMPPHKLGLDKCYPGDEVGSKAVYDFIEKVQPAFTLHGHIHESPEVTGRWYNQIESTIVIQPGQSRYFPYVVIDLIENSYERHELLQ